MSKVVNVEIKSEVNELFAKSSVIQRFSNDDEKPLELKIYIYKKQDIIFDSFTAQIGNSIKVKSKIIKKEKAEKKYTDSIASGNAAIFVCEDPKNENRIIINMGNIPPKQNVILISEFISFIEYSKKYEFELFRNLPIFNGNDDEIYQNFCLKGKIHIKTKNKIINISKEILCENLKINEERYLNEEQNEYLFSYEIKELPFLSHNTFYYSDSLDSYIPSSKIYFNINFTEKPIIYKQKSSIIENEQNLIIQYKNENKENLEIYPALFIFLVDQSGSMSGKSIQIVSEALILFLKSLPAGSYYQIIGFGSNFKKYDDIPKEYTHENINNSIEFIKTLDANLGGTNIYKPLKYIFSSNEIYDKIKLPRNIFLLTDGEINDKKITLELIEKILSFCNWYRRSF